MRDPDERIVHCLEAINKELHETNKQLKIANQLAAMEGIQAFDAPDTLRQRAVEIVTMLDLA